MPWIKATLSLVTSLPKLFSWVGSKFKAWKYKRNKVKMDQALEKAKKEGKTTDLQKQIGKKL